MILSFLILSILNIQLIDDFYLKSGFHEFHLSKCEIEFNNIENSLEIAIQLFIDDTEAALASRGKTDLKLFTDEEHSLASQYIHEYLVDHFKVSVDGMDYKTTWIGKEISEDLAGLWCYIEIKNVEPQQRIVVSNDVLMEQFDDQRNIVKLRYDAKNKAYFLLDKELTSGELLIKS